MQGSPSLASFSSHWLPEIERVLVASCEFEGQPAAQLHEAMRYSLLSPGKRIRPLLCLLACDVCGGDVRAALPPACAVEMVHAFSLIHDDLPCMDDDDLRRGRPTNHTVYGEAIALLAGDALLVQAFQLLADHCEPLLAGRCCGELAAAAGPTGMAAGQVMDMLAPVDADLASVTELHRRKTGALIVCALRLGGLAAEVSDDQLFALTKYGEGIGLAFQITDDLLDVTGDEAMTGKKVGKDEEKGKKTFLSFLSADECRARAGELIREAVAALSVFGERAAPLKELAEAILHRRQ